MSFQANVPPTVLAKLAKSAEADTDAATPEDKSRKREDWKKLKELEEARKAGTAPAMKDEEGKDINPHIPQYIMQAPWYFGADTPTLRHQRQQEEKMVLTTPMERWYKRGVKEGAVATKYRKGACENCGAMTHKKKDCLERPRKLGAKHTGTNIAPDEHVQNQLDFDYDSKRDRWNGFDTDEYTEVIQQEYAKLEEAKRLLKAQQLETDIVQEEEHEGAVRRGGEDSGGEDDEDKYADDVDMPGQKFESKQRITVRNLRIREDTAKYLYNLDINSAHYDPKSRSMRQNPFDGRAGANDKFMTYQGDNFVRYSGDALQMANKQIFAWEAYEKGADIHLQADPTQLELLTREYKQKKDTYKDKTKQSILDKYGGEEHLEAPAKELLLAQSENYVEYSRHGTIIKGAEKAKMKSIYEEDVYLNNHNSVWGSYWKDGQWGFKCCHSLIKESYCTGAAGRSAGETPLPPVGDTDSKPVEGNAIAQRIAAPQLPPKSAEMPPPPPPAPKPSTSAPAPSTSAALQVAQKPVSNEPVPARFKFFASAPAPVKEEKESKKKSSKKKKKDKKKKKRKQKEKRRKKKKKQVSSSSSEASSSESSSSSDSSSESEDEDVAREKRIKEAMSKEEKRVREVNRIMKLDERKRPYNSMYNEAAPTEDDIEAFQRKRLRDDDPMAQFLK